MLVSHQHRFIYTKTAKTAGTSVEVYFEPYCMPENEWEFSHGRGEYVSPSGIIGYRGDNPAGKRWYNHMPAKQIRQQLGRDVWDRYFKFCVVRNPFDKLVSAFHYFDHGGKPRPGLPWQFGLFGKRAGSGSVVERFRHWVKSSGFVDRDRYVVDGALCMDYFIRQEVLSDGVRCVCEQVGVAFRPERILRLKEGTRRVVPLHEYYDPATIALVSKMYRLEIESFGYAPPIDNQARSA